MGLNTAGATVPAWSGRVGYDVVADSRRIYAVGSGRCVLALAAANGALQWSWRAAGSPTVMGLEASAHVVLVTLGHSHGQAPAMVYPATDQLIGLDPQTGAQLWRVRLGIDGQSVPAVIAGEHVVIARADGTVIGVDARTGTRRWANPLPAGCTVANGRGGLSPAANVLPDTPATIVLYQCSGGQRLARIDPATGATQWTWQLPAGWWVQYQSSAGESAGVLGVIVSGHGIRLAPINPAPTQTPRGYETDSLVALDTSTGRPLWQLPNVVVSAGVYAGSDQLCLVSGYGITCYAARTGQASWHQDSPAPPHHGGPDGPDFTAAVVDAGRLYLATATNAAAAIPSQSTTYRAPAGAFQLQAINMADGHRLSVQPLPAFYAGRQQVVVSPDTPLGVIAVTDGRVFVSAQLHETNVVEAFTAP